MGVRKDERGGTYDASIYSVGREKVIAPPKRGRGLIVVKEFVMIILTCHR